MNKRSMFALAAVCVAGPLVAQTPPTPVPARKAPVARMVVPQVVVPPIDIPPIVIPPIDIPPIVMPDVLPAIDAANRALRDMDLSHLDMDLAHMEMQLQGIQPALSLLDAMPPMPAMPPIPAMPALEAMPAMPALAGIEFGTERAVERAMMAQDRAMAQADRALTRAGRWRAQDRSEASFLTEPPAPSGQQDVGDSLYQAARTALNRGNYESAARLFHSLRDRYSRSTYVGDSYYWEAYALYRQGGSTDAYRQAVRALDDQKSKYPRAATRGDSDQLRVRILGELARRGDADAAAQVDAAAHASGSSAPCANRGDDEDDVRITALNALMQMNSEDAMPVLKQVLAKRDACSAELRRKAVYVVSSKRSEDAEPILLDVVRNDPDRDVRMAAVSAFNNFRTERSAVELDSIIRSSADMELKQRAIMTLAQHPSPKAGDLLRAYVSQGEGSDELREYAIMYLASSRRSTQNSDFLRDQYKRTTSRRIRERIVSALAQAGGADNAQFLIAIAMDDQEQPDTRRQALFQASQSRMISFDSLTAMYDRVQDREMKGTLLSIYGMRRGGEGVDKLIDIVKKEKDRELRNRAVQFLGQSRDPKAAQFLAQLINQ